MKQKLMIVFSLSLSFGLVWAWQGEAPANPTTHKAAVSSPAKAITASKALHNMDTRVPVPLQPMMAWHQKQNMIDHLKAIQEITAALARKDWAGVQKASRRIESSPQMRMMCSHMGAGAKGFSEFGFAFHRKADKIAVFAKKKDMIGVLNAVAITLQACNNCHTTYKQEVVDAKTWQARTGKIHSPGARMRHMHQQKQKAHQHNHGSNKAHKHPHGK